MSKPTLVLVPGAWHAPFYMATVQSHLEAAGYTIFTRQFPGVGASTPPTSLTEDIALLRTLVEEAIGSGNDVVAIVHSWGGILAGTGLTGLSKQEREAAGLKGGVVRVGYMTAFMVDVGVSLLDAIGGKDAWWFDVKPPYVHATDPSIFYNDLPEREQAQWFAQLQSQTYATFLDKTTAASWKVIPSAYLVCEEDMAIPVQAQDAMVQAARAQGARVDVTRVKAGHSPFLSVPDVTGRWVRGVAGEEV